MSLGFPTNYVTIQTQIYIHTFINRTLLEVYIKLELVGQIWPKERQYGFTVICPSVISDQEMLQQEGMYLVRMGNVTCPSVIRGVW